MLSQRNICIDLEGNAVLWDFDLVRARQQLTSVTLDQSPEHENLKNSLGGGPVRHTAPELLLDPRVPLRTTTHSDVYSLGMTILELWTLEPIPFSEHMNGYAAMHAVLRGERPRRPSHSHSSAACLEDGAEEDLWQLSSSMWAQDPSNRPAAEDIVETISLVQRNSLMVHKRGFRLSNHSMRIGGSRRTEGGTIPWPKSGHMSGWIDHSRRAIAGLSSLTAQVLC